VGVLTITIPQLFKQMKISNIKKYKSTVLGLAFIAFGGYLIVEEDITDYWIISSLMVGGTLLLFTGDKFIHQLEKLVFGRILFDKKGESDSEE
jgi:hypothetical protein